MAAVHVTVVFGKHSTHFSPFLLQGRDVTAASALTPGWKLLLLCNRAFYEKVAALKQVEPSMDAVPASSQQLKVAGTPRTQLSREAASVESEHFGSDRFSAT
ncbi:hypothetical protein PsorP6_012187 [Peronosclerospora sorghi]|uniref:Uncharacterized protein n=1 Tax=Peronosclerospora sorghi TaxID=230839 RepID=A0ACC0WJN9_9STRA|nr:hypothetical protein PsorP6_012187 [Peronosclerospora sorghi]